MKIRDLKGLGPKSEALLQGAGIQTPEALRSLGAVRAFDRLQKAGAKPSLNFLYALEGAIAGRHWQEIARFEKSRLLMELDGLAQMDRMDPQGHAHNDKCGHADQLT